MEELLQSGLYLEGSPGLGAVLHWFHWTKDVVKLQNMKWEEETESCGLENAESAV